MASLRTVVVLPLWRPSPRGRGGLHPVELRRVIARQEPDLDEVERADEPVADAEAARARDRVAEAHGPVVLDQQKRGGRVVRDVLENVPCVVVGEGMDAVGAHLGARGRTGLETGFSFDAQADQRADLGAELDRLILREVAEMLDLDLAVGVLVHGKRVDHAHRVARAKPLELRDDLAVEVRLVEAQDDELHWSYRHQCLLCGAGALLARLRTGPRCWIEASMPRKGGQPCVHPWSQGTHTTTRGAAVSPGSDDA